ncbi:MAG TPA: thioesterase family protein [Terriglobales bacterium]|nr:thioesterase family protein [Terriglobales bacterium]
MRPAEPGWLIAESYLSTPPHIGITAFALIDLFAMKPVPPGVRGETEHKVAFEDTLTFHDPQLPPVFSTPHMIGLMEVAAFRALQPYCEGDEITVGTAINIEHRAATGVGALVKAQATLESSNGRFYVFRVSARDDIQEIGSGTVSRAVVSLGKFMQRLAKSSGA